MTAVAALTLEPAPLVACTVSRDVTNFDLLVEDMETELGEGWGDLRLDEALAFLGQPEASALKFLAIAVDAKDEAPAELARISGIIQRAKQDGVRVILITENLGTAALHQLLRLGADDFVPYPLPEGALHEAIARLEQTPIMSGDTLNRVRPSPTTGAPEAGRDGSVLVVQGLAGGVGATMLAVNLAWELSAPESSKKHPVKAPSVCLIDFDLQFGSVSTSLDLPRREAVFELLSDTARMDKDSFLHTLESVSDTLKVLTAPADMLPLDFIDSEDVKRILTMARNNFDYVIVDMPKSVVSWTEAALSQSHIYFSLLELEMRSAQNTMRMVNAFRAEGLDTDKMRFVLNRAPKFTDFGGKTRVRKLAQSLGISLELQLPDGGHAVTDASDHGLPLGKATRKSPLRLAIQKLAKSITERAEAARATA